MKVIDAHTGVTMAIGQAVPSPSGQPMRLLQVKPGMFSASALIQIGSQAPAWTPLVVRWFYPGYWMQHIAFIPS